MTGRNDVHWPQGDAPQPEAGLTAALRLSHACHTWCYKHCSSRSQESPEGPGLPAQRQQLSKPPEQKPPVLGRRAGHTYTHVHRLPNTRQRPARSQLPPNRLDHMCPCATAPSAGVSAAESGASPVCPAPSLTARLWLRPSANAGRVCVCADLGFRLESASDGETHSATTSPGGGSPRRPVLAPRGGRWVTPCHYLPSLSPKGWRCNSFRPAQAPGPLSTRPSHPDRLCTAPSLGTPRGAVTEAGSGCCPRR